MAFRSQLHHLVDNGIMQPVSGSESIYNTTRLEGESTLYARAAPPDSLREPTKTFTIDEAFVHMGFGKTQVLMFFFCGIAWAGDGMEMMLLSYLGPEVWFHFANCSHPGKPKQPRVQAAQAATRSCHMHLLTCMTAHSLYLRVCIDSVHHDAV